MDPILMFLERDVLLEEKSEAKKVRKKLLCFGCPRTKSCTNVLFLDHIYFAYISMHRNHS